MSVTDDDITLGFIHLSSAEMTKDIAIFYARISEERILAKLVPTVMAYDKTRES